MVPPPPAQRRVSRRINPRESPKIIGKVRLVIVAATQRQLRPRHIHSRMKRPRRRLKPMNAAPHLRSNADLFAKDLGQPPLAHPDRTRTLRHIQLSSPEQIDRLIDHLRSANIFTHKSDQQPFQPHELLRRTQASQRPSTTRGSRQTLSRGIDCSKNRSARSRKSLRKSSGPDHDSRQFRQVGGIDHLIAASRANHDCAIQTAARRPVVPTISQRIAVQIQDDLDAAIRQHPLAAIRHLRRVAIPKHPHPGTSTALGVFSR